MIVDLTTVPSTVTGGRTSTWNPRAFAIFLRRSGVPRLSLPNRKSNPRQRNSTRSLFQRISSTKASASISARLAVKGRATSRSTPSDFRRRSLRIGGDQLRGPIRLENLQRMVHKGEGRPGPSMLSGSPDHRTNDPLVTYVDPVKGPDRGRHMRKGLFAQVCDVPSDLHPSNGSQET